MHQESIHQELTQRLLSREIGVGALHRLFDRLEQFRNVGDLEFLTQRLLTSDVKLSEIRISIRRLESEQHNEISRNELVEVPLLMEPSIAAASSRDELLNNKRKPSNDEQGVSRRDSHLGKVPFRTKPKLVSNAVAPDGTPIADVWLQYKKQPTEFSRNILMENYLHLVKYNAERIHAKLPDEVDIEDLMSAGIFGLMDAIDAFDLDRGVKFETYCAPRIRGSILDELRAMDWVPRLVRSRSSQIDGARKSLEMQLGRKPTDAELTEKLAVSKEEFAKMRKDAGAVGIVSLNRKWCETESNQEVREIDVIKDSRQAGPFASVQQRDLKDMITKGLSRAERLIIILYYYEQMTMKEIGGTLDLSESRVSQMHSSILARLKSQLQYREIELHAKVE